MSKRTKDSKAVEFEDPEKRFSRGCSSATIERFVEVLRMYMNDQEVSVRALGRELESIATKTALTNWFSGKCKPRPNTMYRVATQLGLDMGYILHGRSFSNAIDEARGLAALFKKAIKRGDVSKIHNAIVDIGIFLYKELLRNRLNDQDDVELTVSSADPSQCIVSYIPRYAVTAARFDVTVTVTPSVGRPCPRLFVSKTDQIEGTTLLGEVPVLHNFAKNVDRLVKQCLAHDIRQFKIVQ